MFRFNKNINKKDKQNKFICQQAGMTYIELIVVLSIFSVMTSVVLFNYDKFQAKVDIKNLANDIALKIVEAQKSALSGKLPTQLFGADWRPSYGVYFDLSSSFGDNKKFIYFTDLDQSGNYNDGSFCPSSGGTYECLDKISITKNNYISDITVFYNDGSLSTSLSDSNLAITFARPNSEAIFTSTTVFSASVSHVQITIISPSGMTAKIKVYVSGRIQIN